MLLFCIDTSASLLLLPNICAIKLQGEEHSQEIKDMQKYAFQIFSLNLIHLCCLQSNLLVQVGKYLALAVAEHPAIQ